MPQVEVDRRNDNAGALPGTHIPDENKRLVPGVKRLRDANASVLFRYADQGFCRGWTVVLAMDTRGEAFPFPVNDATSAAGSRDCRVNRTSTSSQVRQGT